MFEDNRSKKIILAAHCILNQNSISDGTADFPSQFSEVLDILEENNIGIIQLPCPELMCLGLDRKDKNGASHELLEENSRIRNLMQTEANIEKMNKLAEQIIFQVEEYKKYGFEIIGLIGINRSPSCGVETTSINSKEENGKGVFIEKLLSELAAKGILLNTIGVKTNRVEESVNKVIQFLNRK
jgi:predicted secreted protein